MRRRVIAVSGGVDSVTLLHMMACDTPRDALIVAHFDHGIRHNSADDAVFVQKLAQHYGVLYETTREELGRNASEELARDRRYAFLRSIAKKYDADIVTAHHLDDLVETIAINITRGTGWRGLAVLDRGDTTRPLLHMTKKEIIEYAKFHNLEWHDDETNQNIEYLRNKLRQKLAGFSDDTKTALKMYRDRQVVIKQRVKDEAGRIIGAAPYRRYIFVNVDEQVGIELLRAVFIRERLQPPIRPQLQRVLLAVKTYQSGKCYEVGDGIEIRFTKTTFIVQKRGEMV